MRALIGIADLALVPACAQVHLEEGGQRTPVTIRGLSANGYLLVRP